MSLLADCNANCGCANSYFNPVCAGDVMYFTACAAGCSSVSLNERTKVSCIRVKNKLSNKNFKENVYKNIVY